jgi:hypothetical protein
MQFGRNPKEKRGQVVDNSICRPEPFFVDSKIEKAPTAVTADA